MMERHFSDSSPRERIDADVLALLSAGRKRESTGLIDSSKSAAEPPNPAFSYWRQSAYFFASRLYSLDRQRSCRKPVQTASHWEPGEAAHLEPGSKRMQKLKQFRHGPESNEDGPVSSRLRSRETKGSASRKPKATKPAKKSETGSKATKRGEQSQNHSTTLAQV